MKKSSIILAILFVTLLIGCSSNPQETQSDLPYSIVNDNGEYFLILDKEIESSPPFNATTSENAPSIKFDSISEMVHDIKTGNFTEDELKELARFKTDDDGRVIICDLAKMYNAQMPLPYEYKTIKWSGGDNCVFSFYQGTQLLCDMAILEDQDYIEECIDDLINCTNIPNFTLLSTYQVDDRNATVITYRGFDHRIDEYTDRKLVYYTITDGNKELFVHEKYDTISDTVPGYITIYGTGNGLMALLYAVEERPTVEQLSLFGFREYVETSTS